MLQNNAVVTVFFTNTEKCCPCSMCQTSLHGRRDDYCVYCPAMLKAYQRQTELFEFSWDRNRKGLDREKNHITLHWLCCNSFGLWCNGFWFFLSPMITKLFFLMTCYYQKISVHSQGLLCQWRCSIRKTNFFIMDTKK